ncbi:MAG: DUF4124 domain-containing protein [Rhodoferax sp.]|nr:DUF4124 domain-containing protein [Rhodoferax sp.]
MKNFARSLFLLTSLVSSLAVAQWQWLDKDGHPVFSDRAPPASVPDKAIVKRPGLPQLQPASNTADVPATGTTALAKGAASAPKDSGLDQQLLEKKKKADEQDAAKLKSEEQRRLAVKADNCQRAKSARAELNAGGRLSRTNAQGERVILDDAARAAEAKRIQSVIDLDC